MPTGPDMEPYWLNFCGAWSQFWNAVWGGHRDQSFSSRSWEAKLAGKKWATVSVFVIDLLFFWQPNHCRLAYEYDTERTYR